ncbi:MAG: multiheme c-type cytochrome, partial [Gammaproteobacteria bacterium]
MTSRQLNRYFGSNIVNPIAVATVSLVSMFAASAAAANLPQQDGHVHLGPASCAASQCHGATVESDQYNVSLNEYTVWSRRDPHSNAYNVLLGKESQEIARKLGLPDAHQQDICLDCHADNVNPALRGERFRIEDGVGCEACHGGAEKWLGVHDDDPLTGRQQSLELGMYSTEEPIRRAQLCLSCHLGTADKFATHRIMAAGHPRIRFELAYYSRNTLHYKVDEDYRARKTDPGNLNVWARGLVQSAKAQLSLLRTPLFQNTRLFPELSVFDCHSCHHPMTDISWARRSATRDLQPGEVVLNDSTLVMITAIAAYASSENEQALIDGVRALHVAATKGREQVAEASRVIEAVLTDIDASLAQRGLSSADVDGILSKLAAAATAGEFLDYSSAE